MMQSKDFAVISLRRQEFQTCHLVVQTKSTQTKGNPPKKSALLLMLVISEMLPCFGQKMSIYGPCYPVWYSECWVTEVSKDLLIRRRNKEYFSLFYKAYAKLKRSVPSYQENRAHAAIASPLTN